MQAVRDRLANREDSLLNFLRADSLSDNQSKAMWIPGESWTPGKFGFSLAEVGKASQLLMGCKHVA